MEFSEVETSSSGFSEGETRIVNKATQTECKVYAGAIFGYELAPDVTPTAETSMTSQMLDLKSPVDPCERRFQAAPEYKKLFQEIFTVLKKTVDEKDGSAAQNNERRSNAKSDSTTLENDPNASVDSTLDSSSVKSVDTENYVEPNKFKESKDVAKKNAVNLQHSSGSALESEKLKEHILKPMRPSSLDLSSNCSSRSSSKHSRRRRRHRQKVESKEQKENSDKLQPQNQQPQKRSTIVNEDVKSHVEEKKKVEDRTNTQDEDCGVTKYRKSSNLCEKHRLQQQQRKKSKRNKSRNRHIPLMSLDDPKIAGLGKSSNDPLSSMIYNRSPKPDHRPRNDDRRDLRKKTMREYVRHDTSNITLPMWGDQQNSSTPKISRPSVEVAKLRKLEMSYAEVLKSHMNRANRRH